MQKLRKRILAFLLVFVMTVTVIPILTVPSYAINSSEVKSNFDSVISRYPSGSKWTGTYAGASQCYGFAIMVINQIFGSNSSGGVRRWDYKGNSTSGMNTLGRITSYSYSNVKNLLSNAAIGDVLQFDTERQHTMIIYGVESDGVWIYHCNWSSANVVSLQKFSFGAWAGRNCSRLTLLRSNNYSPSQASSHTVDSKYSKNFTSYLKSPSTNHYVWDSNHSKTGGYVNDTDPCTIIEVYTDGCCKFTYKLSNGGSRTAYGSIDWFKAQPAHTHNYSGAKLYQSEHPHRYSQRCVDYDTCGGYIWLDEYLLR